MKKYFAVSLLAASVLMLSGCQQDKKDTAQVQLQTSAQKQAYAIGASISHYIQKSLVQQDKLGLKLDRKLVLAGMKDGLDGKSQLTDAQMKTILQGLDTELSKLAQEKAKKDAEAAKAAGTKFLADNGKKDGVVTTASGLEYKVLRKGTGKQPKLSDTVTVNYKGTLIDGTTFDSSYARGKPVTFPLNRVIPGWSEGVQLMHVGAKYEFYIPAKLAYGESGAGKIPPNSTLIFDVELLGIQSQAAKPAATDSKATSSK